MGRHAPSLILPPGRACVAVQPFLMETKDFIHGKIDWFKNPIPALDAFEERNMLNISPTIKINISTNSEIVEEIMMGASCSLEEVDAYKSLFQEFYDIFA